MDHLTIPIRDGIAEDRKADIVGFFTDLADQITADAPAIDDDPEIRAEAVGRIKRGMADIDAGRFCDSAEAKRRIAERFGFTLPG